MAKSKGIDIETKARQIDPVKLATIHGKDGPMEVSIEGNHVTIEFDMVPPHPSNSGKRNLRYSSGGRHQVPGAENGLVLMLSMDEARS